MFVVESGSLELVDGHFRFPNTSTMAMPAHFLAVHHGSFALRRCQVIGQMLDGTSGFHGLIRWKRANAEPGNIADPSERGSGVITDSALLTAGKLLDADLRNRTLLLRNSLFASVGDLFDLNVQGFSSKIGGTLDAPSYGLDMKGLTGKVQEQIKQKAEEAIGGLLKGTTKPKDLEQEGKQLLKGLFGR